MFVADNNYSTFMLTACDQSWDFSGILENIEEHRVEIAVL